MNQQIDKYFVESISLMGSSGSSTFQAAVPGEKNAINVLCGVNNAGKTFILKQLRNMLTKHLDSQTRSLHGVTIQVTQFQQPAFSRVVAFGKTWRHKEAAGTINLTKSLELPKDAPDYRRSVLRFLFSQVARYTKDGSFTEVDWMDQVSVRLAAADNLQKEKLAYRCDQNNSLVIQIQNVLRGILYFRKLPNNSIEFILRNNNGTVVPFHEWSDGQQSYFFLLLTLFFESPDILLLDELENHLHPEFMTLALATIKEYVPQTFLTTHHPHAIFSLFADRVFYVEALETTLEDSPAILEYEKIQGQKNVRRRVTELQDDFVKLANSYKLFHKQDTKLLEQAESVANQARILVFAELHDLLVSHRPVNASSSILPDRQTQLIPSIKREMRLLDFGAGQGRQVDEYKKFKAHSIAWTLWEPDLSLRSYLKNHFSAENFVTIPNCLTEIADEYFDFVLLSNVLHELCFDDFCNCILQCSQKLNPTGKLIVLELFPLLKPERFAIPIPEVRLQDFFNRLGMPSTTKGFSIRSIRGYSLQAKAPPQRLLHSTIASEVETLWLACESLAVNSYTARGSLDSVGDLNALLNELTTLASISAWRNGLWKGK